MNLKEMKQAVRLLAEEWNLGKKECRATGNICAWIYLMNILAESEKIQLFKENSKLIGFAGYSKKNSRKHSLKKLIYKLIKNILYNSKDIKDIKALKDYENNYQYLPSELENYFDGELSILLVDKNYRGKNIGKQLLFNIFEVAKNDNIKNLEILTDES